jgi:ABC-2 type transport system ATP-binding protein
VGIIDHGEIIAMGTVGELILQVGEQDRLVLSVTAHSVDDALLRKLEQEIEGITRAVFDPPDGEAEAAGSGSGFITIYARRGRKALSPIIQLLNNSGLEINSVEVREPDLEAVFLHLTGRALRD